MRSCHFENRYYSTDQMLSEYVHRVLCRKIVLFGAPIALVALIFAMLSWLDRDTVFFTLFGVCFLIVLLTALLSPTLMLRQMKEDDRRLHNGQKFETIVQFGDRILIREGTFSLACTYDQIIKIRPLKHSYVLMFGPRNSIMVSPEHFTVGTFDEFQTFIKERCPQLK
ncbi:MAG: hypothetical protein DBY10_04770 [Clostridiales bacterium]|jgi:hypothetical protein|nr:MAG: hypothetical protein DBY10_04770 [Clostridiales bacterium]